ncbi:MAG: TonB-dependent receptor [Gammaproteobacteria bacterium]|nr:TonB-dependent receptor [Gammaproteobacteria bacterium]
MRGSRIPLLLVLSATLTAPGAMAAGETIEEVRVVGARLPRPVADVLGSVDLLGRDELLRQVTVRTEDLVRYLPGVSVARADNRFGATEFTIRGLSGNRVTTLVDGVPVADQFDVGSFSNAGQDYLIPDAISRVEILHGPASTLFGSDALGGVIAVLTRDPEEYLDPGRDTGVSTTLAWSGADQGRELNAAVAGREGATSAVHASLRESEELDAAGTDAEDPLDRQRRAARLALAHALEGGGHLRLGLETFDESVDSRAGAILGSGRQFANTTSLVGDDRRRRHAIRGEYDFEVDGAWAESGRLLLYGQRSDIEQVTDERRERLDPAVAIHREFDYAFEDLGAVLDLQSGFVRGRFDHRLGWGLSLRQSGVRELRDGHLTELANGSPGLPRCSAGPAGPGLPRDPDPELGAYVHDEIRVGAFTLIPALRLEFHDLDAQADPLFREDHPELAVEDVRETALAPKFGIQWRVAPDLDLFAQYARGFRAPPFEDVNIGLEIPRFNVRAIPNPDLEAETSDGIELGLRYRGDRVRAELVLFGADYEDFIESKAFIGPDPATGVLQFQSRNLDRARVFGADPA